jgi:hypothetical protein
MSSSATADALLSTLAGEAARLNLPYEGAPKALLSANYKSADPALNEVQTVQGDDCRGAIIGRHSLLVMTPGESVGDWESCLERGHRQAAVARSWLLGRRELDLYLLFIGPGSSECDPKWRDIALRVERDERVCRKLVWLPGNDVAEGARAFVNRTFLARPWSAIGDGSQNELDSLAAIRGALCVRCEAEAHVPVETLDEWLTLLDGPDDAAQQSPDFIASALVAAWGRG